MGDDILSGPADSFTFGKVKAVGVTFMQYGIGWAELSHLPVYDEIDEDMKQMYRTMVQGATRKLARIAETKSSKGACYDFLFFVTDNIPNMVELDKHLHQHGVSLTYESPYGQEMPYPAALKLILTLES